MPKITGGNSLLDVKMIFTKVELAQDMKIADLGCGVTGHFVFPAAELVGRDGIVYAVDIMRPTLETIERRAKQENLINVKTVWSNLEIFNATKIEPSSLDIVLLINTLYQSHKRVEIIREAARMLKKGGRLVVVEWKNINLPFGPPTEERVNSELLKKGTQKAGLDLKEEFFAGQYHYGLIFSKI